MEFTLVKTTIIDENDIKGYAKRLFNDDPIKYWLNNEMTGWNPTEQDYKDEVNWFVENKMLYINEYPDNWDEVYPQIEEAIWSELKKLIEGKE